MPVANADDIAIVLTGTIVPNAPFTAHSNVQQRRREYLDAIHFYRQFAPVYFLENSSYPLYEDAEFNQLANVTLRQQPLSRAPERGKGYQEFEMIGQWLTGEAQPPKRWVKVTGRYLYRNFAEVFADCRQEQHKAMIIDRCARFNSARTCLFYVATSFYLQHLLDVYRDCNDDSGDWIERVIYRYLAALPASDLRVFSVEPDLNAISGTTGNRLDTERGRYRLKQILRRINFAFDHRELWYARG